MKKAERFFSMQDAWDRASHEYLARRSHDASVVSYGNLAPTDHSLRLLGNLRGRRVLDIGCGGGHNAVACALAGASVVGVDVSRAQTTAARQLAAKVGVGVEWVLGDACGLDRQNLGQFDCILAIQVLQYLDDPAAMIVTARGLLRPGGTLLVAIDHPLRNCFFDEEVEEFSPFPLRSYEQAGKVQWSFGEDRPMWSQHRPLGQWIEWVSGAGLQLARVVEPLAPTHLRDELWPDDSPLAPLGLIPHTAILVAHAR